MGKVLREAAFYYLFPSLYKALTALLVAFFRCFERNDNWDVASLLSDFTPLKCSLHEHDLSSDSYYFNKNKQKWTGKKSSL